MSLLLNMLFNLNVSFNPVISNAPFLYPLKTLQKPYGFLCFQRVEKGCIGDRWVNIHIYLFSDDTLTDGTLTHE